MSEPVDQKVAELMAELARVKATLTETQVERDTYRNALLALYGKPSVTPQEIAEIEANGVPGEQILAELEQMLRDGQGANP